MPDADDTARALLCMSLIGRDVNPTAMISMFDAGKHFKTYEFERNSSFSANCNVLRALLQLQSVDKYTSLIYRSSLYLCDTYQAGPLHDKWVCYHLLNHKCEHVADDRLRIFRNNTR